MIVIVNAILHLSPYSGGLADIHKAVKLADVGRRRVRDSDFNGVEPILEAFFLEQKDWNIIQSGIGVDCLLVGSIYRRRISHKKN